MDIKKIIELLTAMEMHQKRLEFIRGVKEDPIDYNIGDPICEGEIIEKAKKVKRAEITDNTYAIISLLGKQEPYKTLLLNLDDENILSKESANVLLNRKFRQNGMEADELTQCTNIFFPKKVYKLPYVYNGKVYLPISGSMRKAGNWIAAHLIVRYGVVESSKHVWIEFDRKVRITVDISIKGFETQLNRITKVTYCQREMVSRLSQDIIGQSLPLYTDNGLLIERKIEQMIDDEEMLVNPEYFWKLLEARELQNQKRPRNWYGRNNRNYRR